MEKKEIVSMLIKKGVLISPDILSYIKDDSVNLNSFIEKVKEKIVVVNDNFRKELDKISANIPTETPKGEETKKTEKNLPEYDIIFNYNEPQLKKTFSDFVNYFNDRYRKIQTILQQRTELSGVSSIRRLIDKKDRETVSIIGMVNALSTTKNGNIMLTIEDSTGIIKTLISKSKPELFKLAQDIVLDSVIGIVGSSAPGIVFVTSIIFPDIPIATEQKTAPVEAYAIFLGDMHIGSKFFLKEDFERCIQWLRGDYGNDTQKKIAKKTKYVFFTGDLVDGVGIYPNQVEDLEIKDIYDQYNLFTEYVKMIPDDKLIIIIPGNHDATRISEPQPPIDKTYLEELYDQNNIIFLSNPSLINIAKAENFSGFNILLYHGYSFPYFSESLPDIRANGGLERVDLILKSLLQKRHLAPSHTSNLYIPGNIDPLVITQVPDIIVSGHVHRTTVAEYRSVSLINASCWISETNYQKKVGLKPQPSKAIVYGLHNRKSKIYNFAK